MAVRRPRAIPPLMTMPLAPAMDMVASSATGNGQRATAATPRVARARHRSSRQCRQHSGNQSESERGAGARTTVRRCALTRTLRKDQRADSDEEDVTPFRRHRCEVVSGCGQKGQSARNGQDVKLHEQAEQHESELGMKQ